MSTNQNKSREDLLLEQHEEYFSKVTESGQPVWMLDLYSIEPELRRQIELGYVEYDPFTKKSSEK